MANTTNLNLVKPAGTDKALVSVLNSNSDKIDAWAGTTNQALSNVGAKFTSYASTLAELNTLISALGSGERATVRFSGTVTNSIVDHNAASIALLTKMDNATADMLLYTLGGGYIGAIRYSTSSSTVTKDLEVTLNSNWTGLSDYKAQIESSANAVMLIYGKVRTLSFQGVSRAHTENEVLLTLPSEHRPIGGNFVFTVGTVGAVPVIIRINGSNGEITLYVANNAGTGRIYFNMTWAVA